MPTTRTAQHIKTTSRTEVREGLKGREVTTDACRCGNYSAKADGRTISTHCGQRSGRIFAQGHDAKMKSMLIEAGAAGIDPLTERYFVLTGEVVIVTETWVSNKTQKESDYTYEVEKFEAAYRPVSTKDVVNQYGFAHQVAKGVAAEQAKAGRKAIRAGRKPEGFGKVQDAKERLEAVGDYMSADLKVEVEAVATQGQVKVGRWFYDISTGEFGPEGGLLYIAKDGTIKEAKVGAETR